MTPTKHDYYSAANQEVIDKIVDKEVLYNLSTFVEEMYNQDPDGILDLLHRNDWEEPCRDAGWFPVKELSKEQQALYAIKDNPVYVQIKISPEGEFTVAQSFEENWYDLAYEIGVDPYETEVYEHWLVSDRFAKKLKDKGEAVQVYLGLTIWARTTTGQSISLDYVIGKIAEDMEILEGQKNHRHWKS